MLKESFHARDVPADIDYIWAQMYDIASTQKRRAEESGASAMAAEVYYGNQRGRGGLFRRGRGASRGAARGRGYEGV